MKDEYLFLVSRRDRRYRTGLCDHQVFTYRDVTQKQLEILNAKFQKWFPLHTHLVTCTPSTRLIRTLKTGKLMRVPAEMPEYMSQGIPTSVDRSL